MNKRKLKLELQRLRFVTAEAHTAIEKYLEVVPARDGIFQNILSTLDSLRYRCKLGVDMIEETDDDSHN